MSKTQQSAISWIVGLLSTSEDRTNLEAQFKMLDRNQDGRLSYDEIKTGYKLVFGQDISQNQLQNLFYGIDKDKSGFIEYSEFISVAFGAKKALSKQKIKKVFEILDQDNSGRVSLKEIHNAMSTVKKGGENFYISLKNLAGFSDDREIDFKEFYFLVSKLTDSLELNSEQMQSKIIQDIDKQIKIQKAITQKYKSQQNNIQDDPQYQKFTSQEILNIDNDQNYI